VQELIILVFTLTFAWFIFKINKKNKKNSYSKLIYRQSDMHQILKLFFSASPIDNPKPLSQLTKRKEKDTIKVIVLENNAYWVSDNIFYIAEAVNGEIQHHTAKPIDTNVLSEKDLKKMLFILDKLKDEKNDSGSSGRQQF